MPSGSPPRSGWEVVRLDADAVAARPSSDDLEALADAVREAARPSAQPPVGAEPATRPAAAATCVSCAPRPDHPASRSPGSG